MRKSVWIIASAALLVVLVSWWAFGGSSPEGTAPADRTEMAAAISLFSGRSADELEWAHPAASAQELAMPGGTPALKRPATEADGQFEIAVSAGGKPIASARVRVYLRGPRDPSTGDTQWRFAGGGATGPDGLLKVPARTGAYLIAGRAEGFAAARKEAVRAGGEKLTRVELSLEPGLSLRGRVVERGSGAEVPMAELALTAIADALNGESSAPAEEKIYASADPRGRFEIPNLARGEYELEAHAPGHGKGSKLVTVPRSSELVIELGAASFIQGHVLASDGKPAAGAEVTLTGVGDPEIVTAGQQGDFSAEVSPGVHHVSARSGQEAGSLPEGLSVAPGITRDVVVQLGKAAAIAGLVRSKKTQAPVAGAAVGLSPYDEDGDSGRATTGPDGRFALEPLAPGAYDLVVAAEGYTDVMKKGVTVATGQRFFLTIDIDGTGAVEGTVRDSAGAPVAQAVVQGGQMWGGPFTSGVAAEVRTDADGRYRVAGLDTGKVRLSAGRKPGVWLAWEVVDVREGETAHLDFKLPEPGFVQGRVTGKGGAPLERAAEVRAIPRTNMISSMDIRVAQVGVDGRYRLELAPGQYSLGATYPDEGLRFNFHTTAGVKVEPGRTVEQDLEISPESSELTLAGRVLEPDGSPSAGAMVFITAVDHPRAVFGFRSDEAGHFELAKSNGYAAAAFAVRAVNGGRTGEIASVRSGTQDVVVPLQPGGSILGHLVGAGAQVESYRVETEILDPKFPSWMGQEFAGDRFELHDVPALPMRVKVETPDGRVGSATTTVPTGGRAEVTVSLEAGGTITGRAVGPDRAPVSVAMAVLNQAVYSPPTGTDGRFKLENVAAGKWRFAVNAPWMRSQEQEITLTAGQNLDVGDVTLERIRAEPGTVGAQFTDDGSQVSVFLTVQDGPADRAGVLRGDLLLAVDGQPVRTAAEATTRTTGAPGSTVKLTLKRAGQPLQIEVVRAT